MDIGKLRVLLHLLSGVSALDTTGVASSGIIDGVFIAVQQKLIRVVSDKLHQEHGDYKYFCQHRGDRLFCSPKSDCTVGSGADDFFLETSGIYSETVRVILKYFKDSPYWDEEEVPLELDSVIEDNLGEDGCFFDMQPDTAFDMLMSSRHMFFDTLFPNGFIEPELVKLIESGVMEDVKDYFMYGSDEYEKGLCVLKSSLYPYYLRNAELFDSDETADIMLAVASICALFGTGLKYVDPSLNYGYFVSIDDGYYAAYGNLDDSWLSILPLSIMVAGQVIDELILAKDEIHHFLPENLRRNNAAHKVA